MLACTQGSAPEPTSEDVFLDDSPAQRFFVLSYPGFTSEVGPMETVPLLAPPVQFVKLYGTCLYG